MNNKFPMPTDAEQVRCLKVHQALIAELNLAEREGAQPVELLTALAAASVEAVTRLIGPDAVAAWFEQQAETVTLARSK